MNEDTSGSRGLKPRLSYASADDPVMKRLLIGTVEWVSGRGKLERLYDEVRLMELPSSRLWEVILEKLDLVLEYDPAPLLKVPQSGPVVFVANHPFGVLDGLILSYLVSRVRAQFFVLVNEVLCREELFRPYFLPVDFRETKEAARLNIRTKRQTLERLGAGEAMAIFPAGGVATARNGIGRAQDLEWKRFVGRVIRQTRSAVVPVYFHGQNSRLFQMASQVSLNLRLSLLLHEICNKIGKRISVDIGDPIPFSRLEEIKERQALVDRLREITFRLADDRERRMSNPESQADG